MIVQLHCLFNGPIFIWSVIMLIASWACMTITHLLTCFQLPEPSEMDNTCSINVTMVRLQYFRERDRVGGDEVAILVETRDLDVHG